MSDFPAAVKDNIALVQRGGCNFVEKAINARANGAKAVFIMNEGQTGRTAPGTGTAFARVANQRYPGYVGATLSYATGKRFYDAYQAGTPATVHFKTDNNLTQRIDYDIIAETTTGDPNRIVQVGAHIDGVAAGPGINDDGSGTAMNLAIANQLKKTGIQTEVPRAASAGSPARSRACSAPTSTPTRRISPRRTWSSSRACSTTTCSRRRTTSRSSTCRTPASPARARRRPTRRSWAACTTTTSSRS